MTAAEEGILLLCCRLGDPDCKPLTYAQFRKLGNLVQNAAPASDPFRDLKARDLTLLGCPEDLADRIILLLNREPQMRRYLVRAEQQNIHWLTCRSADYPLQFRGRDSSFCPAVLFYKGDLTLLDQPALAVIGSRQLAPENAAFAKTAGRLIGEEGLVLVSGGAIGADQAVQQACLETGGRCIIFIPDQLERYPEDGRILYLSADGYDLPFSVPRALGRNGMIHMAGTRTLAVQCTHGSGGTWQGCTENLKHRWSELYVFDDGSAGAKALMELGATGLAHLESLQDLKNSQLCLF